MNYLRILSATCDDLLEEVLQNDFTNVKLVSVRYKEQLNEMLTQDSQFNVLLFKEDFVKNIHPMQYIKNIKESYPHIRIVFIMTTTNPAELSQYTTYLHSKQIYDIIQNSDFGKDELIKALFEPKTAQDILQEGRNVSFEEEFRNITMMEEKANNNFAPEEKLDYTKNIDFNYNNNVKYAYPSPKTVTFWSPKGGTGVDTLAIQTAFMLAENTNIDVCLLDLADTPNMHLHLNIIDDHRNFEHLYAQQAAGKLNVYTVDNFIINCASTRFKLPNLHIIPGATQHVTFFKQIENADGRVEMSRNISSILDTLREKFTVVIVILSNNILTLPSLIALQKCNHINMVLENDGAGFVNANKYLHDQMGIFNSHKIDKNKCSIVMNKRYVNDNAYIDKFMQINNVNVDASVGLYPDEAFSAYKSANPLTFTKNNPAAKQDILSVVNTITSMEIVNSAPSEQAKGNMFSWFSKKK